MVTNRPWFRALIACVGSSATLLACGGTPDEAFVSSEDAASSEAGAMPDGARLLTEVRAAGGAFLRFYEMDNGDLAAIGRIDDGNGAVLPGTSAEEADGLADLYAAVAGPNASPAILEKLAASDEATRPEAPRVDLEPDELPEPVFDRADVHAPEGIASHQPDVSTRASCVPLSPALYAAEAAAYKAQFCRTLDGLGSIHCELSVASFVDNWHRARKYRSDSFNQSPCNTTIHLNKWRYPGRARQYVDTVSPRAHNVFMWNTSRDDMDFHTESRKRDGSEASRICTSVNRKK